jgi:integrase
MSSPNNKPTRRRSSKSFRIGKVRAYLRGQVWYLCYREQGRRRQPRVGPDRDAAQKMAAEINAQLEVGLPSALGFEPISIPDLQRRWLDHHEHIRRSSVQTIARHRAATNHMVRYVTEVCSIGRVSEFRSVHAEGFVRYLRSLKIAPNGHPNAAKRRLRDNSVKYILETCSTLMNYAQRQRHLSAYAENPFRTIEISRIPVEDMKPINVFMPDQERQFLEACDDWQLPIFLCLSLTGLRPGELTHLLLPEDLDLSGGWLYVRNKSDLGWRVKTRTEREIPLHPVLRHVLQRHVVDRQAGPVFRQRRCSRGFEPRLASRCINQLQNELIRRVADREQRTGGEMSRQERFNVSKTVWRDMGALREDWVRIEFMRVTAAIGLSGVTAPKTFRHTFATILQDDNVDPLIRNELMGHSPASTFGSNNGLGTTGLYTHTQPATKRRQLEAALDNRPAIECATDWLTRQQ